MDILIAHPYKHHAYNLAAGCHLSGAEISLATPFYQKGIGKVFSNVPGMIGRKASGYYNKRIPKGLVLTNTWLQLIKLITLSRNPKSIEPIYDEYVSNKLRKRVWNPKVVVTLQDHMPKTSFVAKEMGAILWSDQILNMSPEALARINEHHAAYGLGEFKYSEAINSEIISVADIITVPSNYSEGGIVDRASKSAIIKTIPYGVDNYIFDIERGINNHDIFMLARANSVRKGGHLLLAAIEKTAKFLLDNSKKGIHVHFLGGLDSDLLPQYEKLNLPSGFKVSHGFCANSDVPNLLRRADFFLMPTLSEGMSLAMTEAMIAGVPILTTKYCGVDYFDRNSMGVEVLDTEESVCSGLREIFLNMAQWEEWGKNCKSVARSHTWNHYESDIAEFVRNLVSGGFV